MPTAACPSSPAKSGSHSAIVEPMSAPTRRPAPIIAWRKATPSGMCEARMITSGRAAASCRMTAGQLREDEVVGDPGDDRHARGSQRSGRRRPRRRSRSRPGRRRSRAGAATRAAEARGKLRRGERGRVRPEVRPAGADPEDEREPAAGEAIGDRARLPVDQARGVGGRAGGDGQVRRVRADHDADAVGLQRRHDRRRPVGALEVAHVEHDLPPADAARRVHQVRRDPDPSQLLAGERRGGSRDGEDGTDPDRRRRCRRAAGEGQRSDDQGGDHRRQSAPDRPAHGFTVKTTSGETTRGLNGTWSDATNSTCRTCVPGAIGRSCCVP